MSAVHATSEHLVRRLRAHGLVPAGTAVRIEVVTLARPPVPVRWKAVNAVTGEDLGAASCHYIGVLAASRQWRLARCGTMVMVEPGDEADG